MKSFHSHAISNLSVLSKTCQKLENIAFLASMLTTGIGTNDKQCYGVCEIMAGKLEKHFSFPQTNTTVAWLTQ